MKKYFLSSFVFLLLGLSTSCAIEKKEITPIQSTIVETVKTIEVSPISLEDQVKKTHKLGIIGEVEPVYFLPMKKAILSRIDTGAATSSIGAENINLFEREGSKWVSFDIVNKKNGEHHHFEKKVYRKVTIKRQNESEERIIVLMMIKIGNEKITAQFSLSDRTKFDYQGLIGRNILNGRAIVDTSIAKTLY